MLFCTWLVVLEFSVTCFEVNGALLCSQFYAIALEYAAITSDLRDERASDRRP